MVKNQRNKLMKSCRKRSSKRSSKTRLKIRSKRSGKTRLRIRSNTCSKRSSKKRSKTRSKKRSKRSSKKRLKIRTDGEIEFLEHLKHLPTSLNPSNVLSKRNLADLKADIIKKVASYKDISSNEYKINNFKGHEDLKKYVNQWKIIENNYPYLIILNKDGKTQAEIQAYKLRQIQSGTKKKKYANDTRYLALEDTINEIVFEN